MNRFLSRALLLALGWTAMAAWGMSQSKEIEIGREMHKEILAKMPIYENAALTQYVARIGQQLAKNGDRPELEYTFTVIDSGDINAFATPGGFVYVNRGLLAYLDSEAELAAVVAHEIAHITERHASRQDWMSKASGVGSAILGVLVAVQTGSGAVGGVTQDAASSAGTAMVRGYGRDMELEADRVGARIMHKTGYDPQAMIEVLSVLKEQESFMRARARKEGTQAVAYHGVFSTHPRNDERLKEVVAAAGELDDGVVRDAHAEDFRAATEGMKFSEQARSAAVIDNRYYNGKMGFTVAFPTDWKVVKRSSTVLAGPNRDNTILQMSVKRALPEMKPAEFAASMLNLGGAREAEDFSGDEITGYTALYPGQGGAPPRRIAVLYFGSYAYVFEGRTANAALASFYDTLFVSSVRSFRPMSGADRDAVLGINVHYLRAPEGISFAKLAEISPQKPYPEETLRLVNGYYPRGEPQPGEWIKVFR
ncbi:MAG: M48 family metalloprotease [Gammaproteobacteria bacterium]|jgi:predicted Zn-dependent protease|nr:M48 family metalloprotease [Gammaproteobacteria bacterium]MBP6051052.1 M48 family metalloprotease [Pseudomonadales bacterium]MBK7168595.1 M48 family metalloprotease [Gammaproteobacteria bacterium]MBK7520340.1 M48 family metalloprotease [Gammaproteobacteria bacterium]MBK7728171.1 M48 family metalloprotease [Gammaproteobacteria bacterium]